MSLRVTQQNNVSVYTVSGSDNARALPDWLARKRKRSLKNDEVYQNRIELIQDFEFEEASQCIQVSEDGEYAMATGTYKPQIHVYHLPSSALKFARHTSALNQTFLLLSSDYSKSLHLQTDRSLEFHTPMGCHYATRIPRYGRGLAYLNPQAQAVVPAEGREVFRLDLEAGRFLMPIKLGGYDTPKEVSSGECVATAETSHGLLAFGTDIGTTEFWDPRSRNRVGVLAPPANAGVVADTLGELHTPAVTAAQFHSGGLTFATGNAAGIVTLYDVRSPAPLLSKDQGYGFPIQTLQFLNSASDSVHEATSSPKVLSADKRIIKLWDQTTGTPWTSIEPSVDINHVCHVPNSGMILTANEGREMHSFLIPALGPAPWWCAHLDTQIEQLADARAVNDPDAYVSSTGTGEAATYDNYKFLTKPELRQFGLDELLANGKGTAVIRPYMHGYFVDQRLYDEARLIKDPFEWERERQRMIDKKLEKERESRIRTSSKLANKVKVNQRLAERLERLEEKLLKKKGQDDDEAAGDNGGEQKKAALMDDRFKGLFEKDAFAVDETSHEFKMHNPSTKPTEQPKKRRTAAEEKEEESNSNIGSSSSSDDSDEDQEVPSELRPQKKKDEPQMRISTSSYRKSGHDNRGFEPAIGKKKRAEKSKSFGERTGEMGDSRIRNRPGRRAVPLGDKEITFYAGRREGDGGRGGSRDGRGGSRGRGDSGRSRGDRRSASGNVFRREGLKRKD